MQRTAVVLLVAGACAAAPGCVHRYAVAEPKGSPALRSGASVYVALAADGRDDRPRTYAGSGKWTTDAIVEALRLRGFRLVFGTAPESIKRAIATGRANHTSYVVYPHINRWEDRATEWSGRPDSLMLSIRVLELSTGKAVDFRTLEAKSRWATLGGDHPQDLLPELISRWASGLAGAAPRQVDSSQQHSRRSLRRRR